MWSNEDTFRFLEIYQGEDVIWNPANKLHKDKKKHFDAWQRIAQDMGRSIEELKKKKESLMFTFRKHRRKKQQAALSGSGADDTYKPIWLFYTTMESFLGGLYECASEMNTEEDNVTQDMSNSSVSITESEKQVTPQAKKALKRKQPSQSPDLEEARNYMKTSMDCLNNILKKKAKKESDDEYELYGRLLAKRLRKLPTDVSEELMHEIDELIYLKNRQVKSNNDFSDDFLALESEDEG